jgi:hypothetical protein
MEEQMKNKNKRDIIFTICMVTMIFMSSCKENSAKNILKGKSFYYADTCEQDSYYIDEFRENTFTEYDYNDTKKIGNYITSIGYKENTILLKDEADIMTCEVKELKQKVVLHCRHEDGTSKKVMWKSLVDAKKNKESCE